mmetsp:Transcript_20058/g.60027  ORF Transcript_20058/g.60027 Transcript_20058/m.60027 type:complete len:283 (+) Transcript_20058:985-1833(+)
MAFALVVLEVVVFHEEGAPVHAHDFRPLLGAGVVAQLRVVWFDEPRNLWVHAPLLQQRHMVGAIFDEALEQRDVQMEVFREPVYSGGGPQLLVVADENDVLRAGVQRCQDVGFKHLGGFFHDDHLRPELFEHLLVFGNCGGRHAYDLHLAEQLQLSIALQGRAVLGIALDLPRDLRELLAGLVVMLQHPLPVSFPALLTREKPQLVRFLGPHQAAVIIAHGLLVILPVWQPRVFELEHEVSRPGLFVCDLLDVQLAVMLLLLSFLLLCIVGDLLGLLVDLVV